MSANSITKQDIVYKLFSISSTASAAFALLEATIEETDERCEVSRVIEQVADLARDLASRIDNSDIAVAD